MIAFLDTSILVRDFSLRSAPFQILFGAFSIIEDFRVLVPEVVIDEAVANFHERLVEEFAKERHATEKLARLLDAAREPHGQPLELVQRSVYEARLRERLSSAGC